MTSVCVVCGHLTGAKPKPRIAGGTLCWNESFVKISSLESTLVRRLLETMPYSTPREVLLLAGWGKAEYTAHALTMAISHLRKKLWHLHLSVLYENGGYYLVEGRLIREVRYGRPISLARVLEIEECFKDKKNMSQARVRSGSSWATVKRYYKIFRENPQWQQNYPTSVSSSSPIRVLRCSTVTSKEPMLK